MPTETDGEPDLMLPGEVASRFRVDAKTPGRWIAAGKLPDWAYQKTPGGQMRFKRRWVELAAAGKPIPADEPSG
jgi:hypothetical protein